MLMTDSERLLGARHPNTLATREGLAAAFLAAGQPKDAIEHYKRLVADTEAAGGHDHPDAIAARTTLASAYGRSGKRSRPTSAPSGSYGRDPAKTGNSRLVRTRIASRKSIRRVCR